VPFDLVLANARIIDGTGSPWRTGDVGIRAGRIAAVETSGIPESQASKVVDIHGLTVTPGFINIHSHLDFSILAQPAMESSVLQGITTELGGQCGQSIAPTDQQESVLFQEFYRNHWDGLDLDWRWATFGDYLNRLEQAGTSTNFGMQVGHQNLRLISMGYACRAASQAEIDRLKHDLSVALSEGAFGMSCGLQWAPGFFSATEEIIQLGKIVAQFDGFLAFHMRSEGDKVLEAVAEVIEIGEKAGVPVQISHLKAAGKRNFGKVNQALEMVQAARARGVDVLVDIQPYGPLDRTYAAENMWMRSCIPPWALAEAGGYHNFQQKLADPTFRARLRQDVEQKISPLWQSSIVDCMFENVGWEGLVLGTTSCDALKPFVGKSVAQIAQHWGKDPYDTYFDLLQMEDGVASGALYFMMDPPDVRTVVESPYAIPEIDPAPRHNHPRKYGGFVRYLVDYGAKGGAMTLEEAVRKITSFPASRLGLTDRGSIVAGQWADICVFDADALVDRANFVDTAVSPAGVVHVLVNGEFVVQDGKHTGATPGKVLRKQAKILNRI
jgi:N-acyl-D-amino-acid deacylase